MGVSPGVVEDLLQDLAAYKSYKDKAVMMAARSLIQLYRTTHPELLHRRDRGRPTEATAELLETGRKYGETSVKDYIAGAEVLEPANEDDGADEEEETEEKEGEKFMTLEDKKAKAKEVTMSRISSDADFRKIDAAQLKKQVQAFKKGQKNTPKKGSKSGLNQSVVSDAGDEEDLNLGRDELVDLANIEMVHKKRRHDKEARLRLLWRDGKTVKSLVAGRVTTT